MTNDKNNSLKTVFECETNKMTLSEGIVKINSRILDSTELKKYDKLEKEGISICGYTNKGKKDIHDFSTVFFLFLNIP